MGDGLKRAFAASETSRVVRTVQRCRNCNHAARMHYKVTYGDCKVALCKCPGWNREVDSE